jgi:serine/threonine protein phosphatase PrpC
LSDDSSGPEAEATMTTCPTCGASVLAGETFCEACGASLSADQTDDAAAVGEEPPAPPVDDRTRRIAPPPTARVQRSCPSCGGTVADDGYCTVCGARGLSERDHWEERPASWIGAVCDKGIHHERNEDAMANAALPEPGSFAALVVCDGVTTAASSDIASLAAARAARDVLAAGSVARPASPSAVIKHWTDRLAIATTAANEAAADIAASVDGELEPPSCTFVAAVVDGPVVVCGWVGDSRAYWLPDGREGVQLSIDDSWATDQIAAGMSREEAEADPRCHAITRWLGTDAPDPTPRCASVAFDGPGWLLVCSDGLWNYASLPGELRRLVDEPHEAGTALGDPLVVAEHLVAFANGKGGHDNITVSLARIPAGSHPDPVAS